MNRTTSPSRGASRVDPGENRLRLSFWLALALLLIAQTVSNGPDGIAGVVIAGIVMQWLAIAILASVFASGSGWRPHGDERWIVALLAGIVLLAIVQLIPLPAAWWTALAGRGGLPQQMREIGAAVGWRPLSLTPLATERSLLSLLPAIAMYLAVCTGRADARRGLLRGMFVLAVVAALLGIAQMAAGPDSNLRIYRPASLHAAVGFFANRNHFGSLLAMLLPFAVGWAIRESDRRRSSRLPWQVRLLFPVMATFVLLVGILLSHSRAGLLLIAFAGIGAMAQLWRSGASLRTVLLIGACGALVGLGAVQIAGNDVLVRLTQLDLGADTRWPVQETTLEAAHRYGFFGSGLGSFVPAYQSVAPDFQQDQDAYVNHANNDYLELRLEAGWPGVLLIGLFGVWFLRSAYAIWRSTHAGYREVALARAASIAIGLALVHAALEYQLRKPAIMVLFGLCCGLLAVGTAATAGPSSSDPGGRPRRRRTSGEKPATQSVRG